MIVSHSGGRSRKLVKATANFAFLWNPIVILCHEDTSEADAATTLYFHGLCAYFY
ncbi:hypothetical protein [Argonema galeatum]|uniref:hypothetical protein n=1 Tax=Argonema galeatum TaxID=2942762 RepID=UPI00201380DE|nr:hypothetical protein [Argonema galeatum]MCL1464471.1 hypothetical protein [Argonema galeatum A003/A1]